MSLINEALKKAQRQRTEDPVAVPQPGAATASTSTIVKRRPPMPARTQILLLGGCAVVLLMGGVLAFLFLVPGSPAPLPTVAANAVKPSVRVAPSKPVVPATPTPAAPAEITISLPTIKPVEAPSAPSVALVPPAQVQPPAPVLAVAAHTTPASLPASSAAPSAPVANPRVYEFLETLRIAGIRVSVTDPKVIMNDRVFRINDVVDRATQLRLTKVDSSTLTFVDAHGYEYQKSF